MFLFISLLLLIFQDTRLADYIVKLYKETLNFSLVRRLIIDCWLTKLQILQNKVIHIIKLL